MRPIGNAKAKPTSQIMTMMTFDISLEGVRRRGYIMARYLEQGMPYFFAKLRHSRLFMVTLILSRILFSSLAQGIIGL